MAEGGGFAKSQALVATCIARTRRCLFLSGLGGFASGFVLPYVGAYGRVWVQNWVQHRPLSPTAADVGMARET